LSAARKASVSGGVVRRGSGAFMETPEGTAISRIMGRS
jgi:hypothetical protein